MGTYNEQLAQALEAQIQVSALQELERQAARVPVLERAAAREAELMVTPSVSGSSSTVAFAP